MKILIVTRGFSESWGGAERVAVNLYNAFILKGHNVDVFAEKVDESFANKDNIHSVSLCGFGFLKGLAFGRLVKKYLVGKDYDVVFSLSQVFPVDIYRASGGVHKHWLRLRYKCLPQRFLKYVFSPVHLVMTWLERRLAEKENCKQIIVNSRLVKKHMKETFPMDPNRITVVYNGVDFNKFNVGLKDKRSEVLNELSIGVDKRVLLYVSNNWKRKGLVTIIKAMAHSADTVLIVVGRGKKSKYEKLARSCGVDCERLKFVGLTNNIERYYGAADIFVLPTIYDPCSNATLEALASGLATITTKENGACEFITQNVSGYLMDSADDVTALVKYLDKLQDRKKIEEIGLEGVKSIEGFTWEKTIGETLKVCELVSKGIVN